MLLDMVLCVHVPDSKLEAALYFFTTIHSCYNTATFDYVLGLCGKVLDVGGLQECPLWKGSRGWWKRYSWFQPAWQRSHKCEEEGATERCCYGLTTATCSPSSLVLLRVGVGTQWSQEGRTGVEPGKKGGCVYFWLCFSPSSSIFNWQ